MNNENNNLNTQPSVQSQMNIHQNVQPQMNIQPQMNTQPKKKNVGLIIGLSIVGLFILGVVTLFVLSFIEEKQETPYKSGQVEIVGKTIQLPMDVETFEKTLDTEIIEDEYSSEIKSVKMRLGYNSILIFRVYVEHDKVTGIMLDAYRTGETDKVDPYASYAAETERDTALKIVFPGNVTIASSIDQVKELYKTKPFNSNYRYWDEEIGEGAQKYISAGHRYRNGDWSINIKTSDDEITGIDYYYLGK